MLQTSSGHSCSLLETAAATTDDTRKHNFRHPKCSFGWSIAIQTCVLKVLAIDISRHNFRLALLVKVLQIGSGRRWPICSKHEQESPLTSQNTISGHPKSVLDGPLPFRSQLSSSNNHSSHPKNQFQALKTWFWMVRCHRHPQRQFLATAPETTRFQTHQKSPLTPQNMISSPQKSVLDGSLPSRP